ncbi:MAG: hypothetical protein A3A04_02565 [Candidatus Harrisonbacteria bacterium RIFCSPLOWO2_01_FULL_40_28]|uniref:Ribulose-phosphate 3-epimerase n=2 Tax=Candidatus Harrisoniibacteriota TaxID=1817905 RepID=A0A1G1ZWT2_9BACT|nr:MAG: hypothetical protein A3A04_02565 [Candidatus Harrisonbacteria bacterium RIFCSPLOWO2_01_FULL_40_28]OGY69002.1 MAG: hypothetical protein A2586_02485 [Candidatus Harrisonbacteria bacterium RIFOXYD1_FULL_40_9]
MIVIPAINARSYEEAKKSLEIIASLREENLWTHIDVSNGTFNAVKSWGTPDEIKTLLENKAINVEIHLMVDYPETHIAEWIALSFVKRMIIHIETLSFNTFESIKDECDTRNIDCMLAITSITPPKALEPYINQCAYFQTLAVAPGESGQVFNKKVLETIAFLREKRSDATIEVDGGINRENAKWSKERGANIIVSASYILKAQNPVNAYRELKII